MKQCIKSVFSLFFHVFLLFSFFLLHSVLLFPLSSYEANSSYTDPCVSCDMNGSIVRFHILADNDSAAAQELKLHIRDAVLEFLQEKLSGVSSPEEAEEYITELLPNICAITDQILAEAGVFYRSQASVTTEFFPIKRYGSLLLPPGNYRALRIVLGRGKGHNWWCMLYPSLCLTKGITGSLSEDELAKLQQQTDSQNSIAAPDSSKSEYFSSLSAEGTTKDSLKSSDQIVFSFRIKELFSKYCKKRIRLRL